MSRKKLLIISHSCVNILNQPVFVSLAQQYPHLDITLLVPSNWPNEYTGQRWDAQPHPQFQGRFITLPVYMPGHISLHFYHMDVLRLLQSLQPDWIYIEEEPWALSTQQIARLNRATVKAPYLFHYNQNLNKKLPPPFTYLEQWVFKTTGHALPVGETSAQNLRLRGYTGPLTQFPYFIDDAVYQPLPQAKAVRAQYGARHEDYVFGYLGRLVSEKGLDTLIRAFHRVYQSNPHAVLWLAGSGPQQTELQALAQSLNLVAPAIQFLPSMPHAEAPLVLGAMDTLVLPSITRPFWREQFGRVLIEALACGTPVIGSDSGEIPHLIQRLRGGLVFPEGDVQTLSQCMMELMTQPDRRQAFIQEGRAKVLADYTHTRLAQVLYGVLDALQVSSQKQMVSLS